MISEMTTGCLCSGLSYVCKNNEMYVTLEKLQSEGRAFYIVVPVTGGHLYERSGQCARHHQHGTVLKLRNYLRADGRHRGWRKVWTLPYLPSISWDLLLKLRT